MQCTRYTATFPILGAPDPGRRRLPFLRHYAFHAKAKVFVAVNVGGVVNMLHRIMCYSRVSSDVKACFE